MLLRFTLHVTQYWHWLVLCPGCVSPLFVVLVLLLQALVAACTVSHTHNASHCEQGLFDTSAVWHVSWLYATSLGTSVLRVRRWLGVITVCACVVPPLATCRLRRGLCPTRVDSLALLHITHMDKQDVLHAPADGCTRHVQLDCHRCRDHASVHALVHALASVAKMALLTVHLGMPHRLAPFGNWRNANRLGITGHVRDLGVSCRD